MIIQPTWLGRPFYPNGCPLSPDQVHVENGSIRQLLHRFNDSNRKDPGDEETLKSYIVYYVNAPIFASDFTKELTEKNLMAMSLDDLISECLDYGLDPL